MRKLLICFAVLLLGICILAIWKYPHFLYGDPLSDANVWVAGENFSRFGFRENFFLPRFERSPELCLEKGCVYTHYPPLPYWLNGIFQKAGIHDLFFFRILGILFSLTGLAFFFFFLRDHFEKKQSALFGVLVMFLHPEFLRYFDSIHQFPINFFCFGGFAWAWNRLVQTSRDSYFFFCLCLFALSTWTTFEGFFWFPIVASGIYFLKKGFRINGWILTRIFALGFIPVLTMVARVWHQSLWFESVSLAIQDLLHSAQTRSRTNLFGWLNEMQKRMILVFAPVILGFVVVVFKKRFSWKALHLPGVFFLAGLSWWIAMPQHFQVHYHTLHLLFPVLMVGVAQLVSSIKNPNWVLLPAILLSMKAPQVNVFWPVDQRTHMILKQTQEDIQKIESFGLKLSQEGDLQTTIIKAREEVFYSIAKSSLNFKNFQSNECPQGFIAIAEKEWVFACEPGFLNPDRQIFGLQRLQAVDLR